LVERALHPGHRREVTVREEALSSSPPTLALGAKRRIAGRTMPHYRIYSLTKDGHIQSPPVTVDCDGDHAAIARAKALLDGFDLEVWEERRRVAVLKGGPHDQG
jgi:hypothetical protein